MVAQVDLVTPILVAGVVVLIAAIAIYYIFFKRKLPSFLPNPLPDEGSQAIFPPIPLPPGQNVWIKPFGDKGGKFKLALPWDLIDEDSTTGIQHLRAWYEDGKTIRSKSYYTSDEEIEKTTEQKMGNEIVYVINEGKGNSSAERAVKSLRLEVKVAEKAYDSLYDKFWTFVQAEDVRKEMKAQMKGKKKTSEDPRGRQTVDQVTNPSTPPQPEK